MDAVRNTDSIGEVLEACDYEPIGDYAIIGDCRSAALVSLNGSIDWLCLPDFSSPSLFAALLDRRRGGRFLVLPRDVQRRERRYLERSAILETTFLCATGTLRLTDFVPHPRKEASPQRLFRIVECVAGKVAVDVAFQPRPGYGETVPAIEPLGEAGWTVPHEEGVVLLQSDFALEGTAGLVAGGRHLAVGEQGCLAMSWFPSQADVRSADLPDHRLALRETEDWWEAWFGQCAYDGPYRDAVMASCLALKLLSHQHSGAVMAALTTSLPESMDAGRNWDYRYCWLRDTSLLLQSFIDLGFEREAQAFLGWLLRAGRRPRLQPLYDLHGRPVPDERELPWLEGYRGRGPVRVGNSAHQQLQLDIFGEVIQTACRFVRRGGRLSDGEKRLLVSLGDSVCRLWRQPDQSIWETRSPPRHYTYSKLMCWVALDRLIALGDEAGLDIEKSDLTVERNAIRREIDGRGFDSRLGSYVGYFGGTEPDAGLLLMVRYRYLEPDDSRMAGTWRYLQEKLSVDGFLYRYQPGRNYDGVEGTENLFAVCSFWAVDYLARCGRVDEAVALFEKLLGLANDVGLYSEQFHVATREAYGNFPQAFTHSGLVTAAIAIEEATKGKKGHQISS